MNSKQIFEILIREHSQMLLTYLRSIIQSPHLIDDIYQQTMITAWQKLDTFDTSRPFAPWLRGIAKMHVLTHYRKSKREFLMCNQQILDHLEFQIHALETVPGDTWIDKIAPLAQCIEQLPDLYRQVVESKYLHEQDNSFVTEQLYISTEALKKRLQRAKQMLFECLTHKTTGINTHDA